MKKLSLLILPLFCLMLNAQKQFTNNGNFMIHPGASVTVYGNFVNNGALVDSGKVITLKGTAAQQIGGTSVTNFKNLTLNNSLGSYLTSNQAITGELNITSGTFSTTGYDFTLISNAKGTARIAPILGNFAGNITMQRYIASGPSDWRFLATPVSNVTINDWQDDFITSGFPGSTYPNFPFVSIYTYDETVGGIYDNGYLGATSSSDPITPGKGYWSYIGTGSLTVDVTGPPVKFNQTFQVTNTQSGGDLNDGYVMIGNPYPSPIDWNSAGWAKNKINDAIYIWNPARQQYASYISGVAVNGGSNLIASSQSFWIQTNGTNPSLSCNENIKVSSSTAFLKAPAPVVSNNLKLIIEGNGYLDETLLQFGAGATNGYDTDRDARKLFSSNLQVPGIASQDSTLNDMSINSLPVINSSLHIPVKTLVGTSGNYTIHIDSSSVMPNDFCIVLEDLATGVQTNLNNGTNYSFTISDTTKLARFILHVSSSHKTEVVSTTCNNYHDGKIVAMAKGLGPWDYLWFDATNTKIKKTFSTFSADSIYNMPAGDYSVQISDITGVCGYFTQKVTISEPLPVNALFIPVRDTLSSGNSDSLELLNMSSGALSYSWDFGDNSPVETSFTPAPHHYTSMGEYMVSLIARYSNCTDTLNQKIVVAQTDHVLVREDIVTSNISVYPNPNNGLFYVKLSETQLQNSELIIYTTSGGIVHRQKLVSEKTEINLTQASKGVYLYKIVFENNKTSNGKIIVQ